MGIPEKHQFRLAMCAHKAVEVGGVCILLMVQGNVAGLTIGHLGIASQTGLLAVIPLLGVTLTKHARHLANRWTSAVLLAAFTFFADAAVHASHYPGAYTEAALSAVGAFVFSVVVSYTPVGKRIDKLADALLHR
jgi:hypothetical protein